VIKKVYTDNITKINSQQIEASMPDRQKYWTATVPYTKKYWKS